MLSYDLGPEVEAFSTNISDLLDFPVLLPAHQAHTTRVAVVDGDTRNGSPEVTGVDALVTTRQGLRIGVKTADCVPILLANAEAGVVAAVHSGWKGTLGNITAAALDVIEQTVPGAVVGLMAVIGPCIHQDAFEVGDEVWWRFADAGYSGFGRRLPAYGSASDVKWHIDLPGIVAAQLRAGGVRQIEVRGECTYTLHRQFYSARRLGAAFSRQRILNCIMIGDPSQRIQ